MQIFHNRPLSLACCILAVTSALTVWCSRTWMLALLILSFVALLLSVVIPLWKYRSVKLMRKEWLMPLCFLGVFVALLGNFLFFHVRYERAQRYVGECVTVEGVVLERNSSLPYASGLEVQIERINGTRQPMRARLITEYASSLQSGDRFCMTATGMAFEDEERFSALANGTLLKIGCSSYKDCTVLSHDAKHPRVLFAKWNLALSTRLVYAVGGEEGALSAALLLGNRSFLSADTVLHFKRSGISHLLALSGLHVSILCAFAEFFLRRICRVPRIARAIAIPCLLLAYLAVTGASPSTVRAVCMVLVLYLAFILRMEYDSFTALSATLAGILTVTPYAVLDISMWMSFLAAASIVIFLPPLVRLTERWERHRSKPFQILHRVLIGLLTAVCVGVSSNLALMWILASTFGEVSLLSLPMTMLLSVPTTLALILSISALLFSGVEPLSAVLRIPAAVMLEAARMGSDIKGGVIVLSKLDALVILLVLFTVLILLASLKVRRKGWFFLPLALAVAACLWTTGQVRLSNDGVCLQYTMLEGNGSICVFSERGAAVAVDASDGSGQPAKAILKAMEEERCSELSDLFLTRYYNMESSYLRTLATQTRLRRLHLPIPTDDRERAIAQRLRQEGELHGVETVFGVGEIGLSSLQIESYAHATSQGSAVSGILFCAVAEGQRVAVINMSTGFSELATAAQSRISQADVLLVNGAGATVENHGGFAYLSNRALWLILEEKSQRQWISVPEENLRILVGDSEGRFLLGDME